VLLRLSIELDYI